MAREIQSQPIIVDKSFIDQNEGAHGVLFSITIVSNIFSNLSVVELLRVQRTCKFWKILVDSRLMLRRKPQILLVPDLCSEHNCGAEYQEAILSSKHWNNKDIRPLLKNSPRICISFYSSTVSEYKTFYLLKYFFHSCQKCFYHTHQLHPLCCICLLSVEYAMHEFHGDHSPMSTLLLPDLSVNISITPLTFDWAKSYTSINSVIPECVLNLFCPISMSSPNQCLILFEHDFSDALKQHYAESDYDFYMFKCTLFREFRRRFRRDDALWGGKVPYARRFAKEASPIFTAIQITGVKVRFYSLTLKWGIKLKNERRHRIREFRRQIKLKPNSLGIHMYYSEISKDIMEIMIGQFFPVMPFIHLCLDKQSHRDNNRENIFSMNTFDNPKHQIMMYPEMYSAILILTYN